MVYERSELNLFDSNDLTKNFKVGHANGVVTMTVPGGQFMTVSGKATFLGTSTCLQRTDGGVVQAAVTLESLFDGLDGDVSTLTTNLASEILRATTQEGVIDTRVTTEVAALVAADSSNATTAAQATAAEASRAQQAEGVLQVNIGAEQTRAEASELAINNSIAALTAAHTSDIANANSAITAEENRALTAEAAIQADVDQNEADADAAIIAAQTALQSNIDTVTGNLSSEAARALGVEAGLQGQISGILSNADPAALDSLAEIVTYFNASDSNASNLLGLLITVVKSHSDLLNTLLEPDLPSLDALLIAAAV